MIPFKEITIKETGVTQRVPWDFQKAQSKLQQFNCEEKEILCKQDADRGRTAGLDVQGDRLPTLVMNPDGSISVDPIASKIHHSGAALRDRVTARWRKFCSVPQNEDAVEYPTSEYVPKEPRKLGTEAPAFMEVTQDTEKRRPGRPRKREMQSA